VASLQGVFVTLFGRPADPAGLAYLAGLTKDGRDWSGLSALASQPEFQARFSGLSDKAAVSLLYHSVFGRAPDAAGLAYWLAELQAGHLDRARLGVALLDGARAGDQAIAVSKLAAAELFSTHLDLPLEQQSYAGAAGAQAGRAFLAEVRPDRPADPAGVDDSISRLAMITGPGGFPGGPGGFPGGGQKPADGEPVVLIFTSPDLVKLDHAPETGRVILTAATINNIEFNSWSLSGADALAFAIQKDSGAIRLQDAGYLRDREVASFMVTATDAAGHSATQTVTVALAGHFADQASVLGLGADPGGFGAGPAGGIDLF
jgi:hypothetical protein